MTASELLDLYDQLMLNDVNFSTYPAEMVLRAFLREYIEEQDQHKIAKTLAFAENAEDGAEVGSCVSRFQESARSCVQENLIV